MIQIRTKGEILDLPANFSIEIEDTNPIFNEKGSQSVPATVPITRKNIRLLDAPHRLDAATDPNLPKQGAEVICGSYMRTGLMNVTDASRSVGISFNLGFDNSTAYVEWTERKLADLSSLPVYSPERSDEGQPVDRLLADLYRVYSSPVPDIDDFAVFPLVINDEALEADSEKTVYWEVMNVEANGSFSLPGSVNRLIDGVVTQVSIPAGYCVSPFLRVWRVLELAFADLGVTIADNPFKRGELAKLVVLNNTADACCTGKINYSDLMPDCSVSEFLNALWVRFGLVYNVNSQTSIADLRFLRDIINSPGAVSLDNLISEFPTIKYNDGQYVKLSAKTSIDSAEPANERFEDFARGLNPSDVRLGASVGEWTNSGTIDDPRWNGEIHDDRADPYEPDDTDWPDPDDRDPDPNPDDNRDHYDEYAYSARSHAAVNPAPGADSSVKNFLAREFVSGMWYRLDSTNNSVRLSSSGFFNWDPQPDGLTALDLSSVDECVPIKRISTGLVATGNPFYGYCPLYTFGARHYHTYIKNSEDSEKDGGDTPLAFLFAYTVDNKTIGRINGEDENGQSMTLDDGSTPSISLLFQFKDGLFANFWRDYDDILRHGNRTVEVKARINKIDFNTFNIFSTYSLHGVRCVIDTMRYSLPGGKYVPVELSLRTIQTQGKYDIDTEQNIPNVSAAVRYLTWKVYSDSFGQDLHTNANKLLAANQFMHRTGYQPHGTTGDWYDISTHGVILRSMERVAPIWENDSTIPAPALHGQKLVRKYRARITFDIYETHDLSIPGGREDYELSDEPLGTETITVDYIVKLYAVWVVQ